VQRGNLLDLATYETALALSAVISVLYLAPGVETMGRTSTLKIACFIILLSGVFRYISTCFSYSLGILIAIDILTVAAFGVVQSLFGVYPAEVVERHRVEYAFRIRRISTTLSRVIGPLLAGVVIGLFSTQSALLFAAFFGGLAATFAMTIPNECDAHRERRKSSGIRLKEIFFGIKLKFILPPERFLTASGFLLSLVTAAMLPMLIPTLIHGQNMDESDMGVFNSLFAAGSVAGIFFLSPLISKKENQRTKYILLWALLTLALAACSYLTEFWQLAPWLFVAGGASGCLSLVGMDKRVLTVPSGVRIRLTAATLVIGQLANTTSYLVTGAIISHFGTRGLPWLYLAVFGLLVTTAMLSKFIWHFLEDSGDAEVYYKREQPELADIINS
jgi:ENTS family enterobactin (siderophore) exporter